VPKVSRNKHNELTAPGHDEPESYETFEEAIAVLRAQLDPGASIDLHHEDCALAYDGPLCTCTPLTLTGGAQA
jgi:alkanesulfonate monooxygenase SsuD/methylene tetrahydromethanopterin reductase-like flavin-dependent oxidoreductase (luciferase family)